MNIENPTKDVLRTTLNSINDALFTVTAGTITFANQAAANLLQCRPEELAGKSVETVIILSQPGTDQKIVLPGTSGSFPPTTPAISGEALLHRADSSIIVEYKVLPMATGDDVLKDLVITITDITERRGTAAKLSQITAEQQIILENVMAGIIYSQERKILWVNKMLEQIFMIKREELEGHSAKVLFPSEEMYEKFGHEAYPQLSNSKGFHTETVMKRADGALFWCKITGKAIDPNHLELGVIWLLEDVSARKQAGIEREKMRAQLLQAQKMEAIGTLAAGVAHDFNNVLTAIQGYLDLAMLKIDQQIPAYQDLERVKTASRKAADLVRQLLLFSRKQPMQLMPVDLKATIAGLLKMLNRFIGEDITIETEIAEDLKAVKGDAGNIEQVLMNIAVNARDAMPNGGILRIKAKNTVIDQEFAKNFPEAMAGAFVSIIISDTGEGISHNARDHIFEPFFTTKETGKGTGLGLSVVYGIIKEHKGWIIVDSEPDQGTTFTIFLPVSQGTVPTICETAVSYKSLQGKGEKILLIEDEEQVRKLSMTALRGNGYKVIAAASVQEARELFDQENGVFDLIFSDIVLPDGNGLELVDQLHLQQKGLRTLLASGYTGHKSRWTEISARKIPFLQKPFTICDLLKAVQDALAAKD